MKEHPSNAKANTNAPLISVCIPTFNGGKFLRQAVDSVLEQDYPNFEILVADNCSTDETSNLVHNLLEKGRGQIRYHRNYRNIGLAGNFNRCLEYARGAYIKFLCVDDLLLPGCLTIMADALTRYPSANIACGARVIINESGEPIALKRYSSKRVLVSGKQAIARCVFGTNFIGEPTAVMFRKSDVTSGFRDDIPQLLDMEMWFRLLEKGDLVNIERPLCVVRMHAAQMSDMNRKSGSLVLDHVKIFEEYGGLRVGRLSPFRLIQHKLATTYRVWFSRKFLSAEQKARILEEHGMGVMYPFMPFVFLALALKKTMMSALFRFRLVGQWQSLNTSSHTVVDLFRC
jgi:glycosyltransferase involved in cell wall biosynthesis